MFYYTEGTDPKLEIRVTHTYSQADLERILRFVNALIDSPEMTVIFNVDTRFKKDFEATIAHQNYHPIYAYQVQINSSQ